MSDIIIEDRDLSRWIIFNRPAQLNTFLEDDLQAAARAVVQAESDGLPIVFSGAGERAFCAGMNLDLFVSLVDEPTETRARLGTVRALLDAVRDAQVVTIAAVNGHCLGAAFELALACDFRIAEPDALMGLPEMKLGLPCILDSALLQQYVGLSLAKEMMLTGRTYRAHELAVHGMVTLADDDRDLTERVSALLEEMSEISPVGIASQKRLFKDWQNLPLEEANDRSMDEISLVFDDRDTRQRILDYSERLHGKAGTR